MERRVDGSKGEYYEWRNGFLRHRREASFHPRIGDGRIISERCAGCDLHDWQMVALVLRDDEAAALRGGLFDGGGRWMRRSARGEEMKVFVPERRVDVPELSEEQVVKLSEGRNVEERFGLEEGDMLLLASEGIPFEAVCYRIMGRERCRIRRRM